MITVISDLETQALSACVSVKPVLAAPKALKSVEETGHSKQHNSLFTPSVLPLVNYMQVFSSLRFFCVAVDLIKNISLSS